MEYELVLTDKYINGKSKYNILFEIKRIDDCWIDSSFDLIGLLPGIWIQNYPSFLNNCVREWDYSQIEYSYLIFGEDIDDDGLINVPLNYVGFSVMEDISLIDKNRFFKLVLQFAEKAIEGVEKFKLLDREIVDNNWIESIIGVIPQIKLKVEQYRDLQKHQIQNDLYNSNSNNVVIRKKPFKFYDGSKISNVTTFYNNWLSSNEFKIYSKSFINYNDSQIPLFSDRTTKIDTEKINK